MRLLFLGYGRSETRLISALEARGHAVQICTGRVSSDQMASAELAVSFGYRHILRRDTLGSAKRPPINLHISLLPYNRGSHPNFWAWMTGTPHGVSIHHIDAGIDTGDLVLQQEVFFDRGTTLSKSYRILRDTIESLFMENLQTILDYDYQPTPQRGVATVHYLKDLPSFEGGWDQPIEAIQSQF